MELPTLEDVNTVRITKFKDQIADTLAAGGLSLFQSVVEDFEREKNIPAIEIAAALAKMARGKVPLVMEKPKREPKPEVSPSNRPSRADRFAHEEKRPRSERFERSDRPAMPKKERVARDADVVKETYRIEVGHDHGVKPGNIVGAIANEAGMDGKNIGRIDINDDHTLLDMPDGLPEDIINKLKGVRISGRQLHLSRAGEQSASPGAEPAPPRETAPRTEGHVQKRQESKMEGGVGQVAIEDQLGISISLLFFVFTPGVPIAVHVEGAGRII